MSKIMKVFDSGSADSGLVHLNTEQANAFIDYIRDESVILKQSRVVKMDTPIKNIAKVDLSENVLYPAQRGVALDPTKRAEATTETIQLISKELIGEMKILDDELEDNIEGAALKEHLMRMFAKRVANQLEKASLYGNKFDGAGVIQGVFDGFITRVEANGNVVDANDSTLFTDRFIDKNKLSKAYKSIKTKFRGEADAIYMPSDLTIDYETHYEATQNEVNRRGAFGVSFTNANLISTERPVPVELNYTTLSSNATAGNTNIVITDNTAGDIVNGVTLTLAIGKGKEFSSEVTNVAGTTITLADALPYDFASANADENSVSITTLDGADVVITPKNNLIYGIQRNITIELDRVARERATVVVFTIRADFQVENEERSVVLKNVKVK